MNGKYVFNAIGIVENEFDEAVANQLIKEKPSIIHVFEEYAEGLYRIEDNQYLDVIFYFHKAEEKQLRALTQSGKDKGVFASRSPRRPSSIGLTSVKLLERNANKLTVAGLDAINGTPVLDIKCSDTSLFASEADSNEQFIATLKREPRIEIRNHIITGRTDLLMIKAAQMHGHYCPGLALGVMAAAFAMKEMQSDSDGMEDLLAITETNNCFSDGVQFITGCTFGNNALIYKELGKTAFTLTKRDGKGLRLSVLPEARDFIRDAFPDFQQLYQLVVTKQNRDVALVADYKKTAVEKAFGTLGLPFEKLFKVELAEVDIPVYAAIKESVNCSLCGENVMANRSVSEKGQSFCMSCSKAPCFMLDGNGIRKD